MIRIRTLMLALGFLTLGWLILSCGSVPTTHYYVLAAPPSGETVSDASGQRLGVEIFSVDPPYDQDRVVYRVGQGSGEVGFYNHHRWAASPGRLVQAALVAGLRGTPGIAVVEPVSANEDYSLLLAGRVIALEEIDLPGRQRVRIQIDLKILTREKVVIRSRFVTVTAEGQTQEVSDIMQLMQEAFSKLIVEVRVELEAAANGIATD